MPGISRSFAWLRPPQRQYLLGMGVVGPAVFREHGPTRLDFESNTIAIGDTSRPAGVETWVPFGESAPLLDIPVQVGDLRIDGHIDTGSLDVLAVPNPHCAS